MNIEQTLERVSSNVDDLYDSFFGTFKILSNQFVHLDNHNVIIKKNEFKILNNNTEPQILSYNIENSRLRYHKNELLPSIHIKLISVNKYNIEPNNIIVELLENVLYLTPPTSIYITYHQNNNLYSIKNMNMATLFLMEKI